MVKKLDKNGKKYYLARVNSLSEIPMPELDALLTTPPEQYEQPLIIYVGEEVFYDSTKNFGIQLG
jgi:hypothetical protein